MGKNEMLTKKIESNPTTRKNISFNIDDYIQLVIVYDIKQNIWWLVMNIQANDYHVLQSAFFSVSWK